MTRKERALRNLKQMCSDGRYLGSGSYVPLEVLEDFSLVIKALEQEPILDKIRAEIKNSRNVQSVPYNDDCYSFLHGVGRCLGIIDKYKAESEVEDGKFKD